MNTYQLAFIVENCALLLIIICCLIANIRATIMSSMHIYSTKDIIEKTELEQKKNLRARELFANGYLPLRFESGFFVCSSLYPDGSLPGKTREYRFPLEPDISEHLTVEIKTPTRKTRKLVGGVDFHNPNWW